MKKLEERGLNGKYTVDSAGTSGFHEGSLPDPRTRANAEQNGLFLNSRSRPFGKSDFVEFDLILTMDRSNYKNVRSMEPAPELVSEVARVRMMRDFDLNDPGTDVPDPYHGGERGFQNVYDILDRSTTELLNWLEENSV